MRDSLIRGEKAVFPRCYQYLSETKEKGGMSGGIRHLIMYLPIDSPSDLQVQRNLHRSRPSNTQPHGFLYPQRPSRLGNHFCSKQGLRWLIRILLFSQSSFGLSSDTDSSICQSFAIKHLSVNPLLYLYA